MSSIVFRIFNGEAPIIEVGKLSDAPVNTLWLYLILGIIFGCVGPVFNTLVLRTQDMFQRFHGGEIKKWVLMGGAIGGLCGILGLIEPEAAGGGFNLIPIAAAGNFSVGLLLFIFITRVVTTLLCFSSGAPGGIFAPMLALERLLGTAFGMAAAVLFPQYHLEAGTFAIAGMGALMAASVRAPLTGIVLVLEMTDNYQLILPMIITCLGATLLAQFLGGKPLYSTILARTLAKQDAEQAAKSQNAPAARILERITRVLDNDPPILGGNLSNYRCRLEQNMSDDVALPLQFTDAAANKVKSLIADEDNPNLKLRVYITGGGCSGFQYGFTFDDQVNEGDMTIEKQGVGLVVDPMSLQYLVGGSVDYTEGLEGSRFIVTNPNAKSTCGCGSSFSI
nr:H(+)/Cl(-) exchange transporter ClcA [Salmonella sp. NCTC 7297]